MIKYYYCPILGLRFMDIVDSEKKRTQEKQL